MPTISSESPSFKTTSSCSDGLKARPFSSTMTRFPDKPSRPRNTVSSNSGSIRCKSPFAAILANSAIGNNSRGLRGSTHPTCRGNSSLSSYSSCLLLLGKRSSALFHRILRCAFTRSTTTRSKLTQSMRSRLRSGARSLRTFFTFENLGSTLAASISWHRKKPIGNNHCLTKVKQNLLIQKRRNRSPRRMRRTRKGEISEVTIDGKHWRAISGCHGKSYSMGSSKNQG